MSGTSILPLLAYLLLHINLVLFFLSPWLNSRPQKIIAAAFVIVVSAFPVFSFIPAIDLPLILYSRAIFGDLSIVTLGLLCALVFQRFLKARDTDTSRHYFRREIINICFVVALSALLLYPTALGLTHFDLYAHGYYPTILSALIFCAFAVSIWRNNLFTAIALGSAALAYAFGLMDSDNLWDYLIDPVLVIYAIPVVIWNFRDYVKSLFS